MSREELVNLVQQGIDIPGNMELLYNDCYGYIKYFAKRYVGVADMEDLMQTGYIGLADAVESYDLTKYPRFTDYLKFRLIRAFDAYLLSNNPRGKVSSHDNRHVRSYLKVQAFFRSNLDREPSLFEYVAYLRTSAEVINDIRDIINRRDVVSMDAQIDGQEDSESFANGILSDGRSVEDEVVESIIVDDLNTRLWEIVKEFTTEEEYSVIEFVFKHSMVIDTYAKECGESRKEIGNRFYRGLGKLRTNYVKNIIINRFGIEPTQYTHLRVSTKNIETETVYDLENELKYISYVLSSTADGFSLLTPSQIQLAYEHGIIDEGGQVNAERQETKPGKKPKEVEQYNMDGSFVKRWTSALTASKQLNIGESQIRGCCKGRHKSAGGFIWRQVND